MNGLPSPLVGEGLGRGGNDLIITPTLILPHQGGGKFFRELDAPQLCCGALHLFRLVLKGLTCLYGLEKVALSLPVPREFRLF